VATQQYSIEIYEPGSRETVAGFFESNDPLPVISVGDLIRPDFFDPPSDTQSTLRVVAVEHVIWEADGMVKHKAMIRTEAEETPEPRAAPSVRLIPG
jgi:hypothetical protein